MSTIIRSERQIKSGYDVAVFLVPTNPPGSTFRLDVSGTKTLPGVSDAETWTISTDDPEQEVAEIITGKVGGFSALSFEVLYDPEMLEKLVAIARSQFTVRVVIDDKSKPDLCTIEIKNCFLVTPGSTSGSANNAAGTMTITLQPRGGGKLSDSMEILTTTRP